MVKQIFQQNITIKGLKDQLLEQILNLKEKGSHQILSHALDLIMPAPLFYGLRVSKLGKKNVEVVIPLSGEKKPSESAIVEAALLANRLLTGRQFTDGQPTLLTKSMQLNMVAKTKSEVRLRGEFTEVLREDLFLDLSRKNSAELLNKFQCFDLDQKLIAEIDLVTTVKYQNIKKLT